MDLSLINLLKLLLWQDVKLIKAIMDGPWIDMCNFNGNMQESLPQTAHYQL